MHWRMIAGVALACCLGASVPSGTAAEEQKGDTWHHGSLEKMDFGKTQDGQPVELYVLKNDKLINAVADFRRKFEKRRGVHGCGCFP